jgi:hypothetical protein
LIINPVPKGREHCCFFDHSSIIDRDLTSSLVAFGAFFCPDASPEVAANFSLQEPLSRPPTSPGGSFGQRSFEDG